MVGLSLLMLATPGQALERRTWVNESIQHTVFRPAKETKVHAFVASTAYMDSLNSMASLTVDPGPVELRVYGGARSFFGATAEGRAERLSLDRERLYYGVEFGRSYYHKQTGAIRLGWFQFPDVGLGFVTVGIETARRINANSPWFFRFLFTYWVNVLGKTTFAGGDSAHLNIEVAKTVEGAFLGVHEVAVYFSVVLRNPDMAKLPTGRYDALAFGLSPTAKWKGATGNWEASVDFRLFLDSESRVGQASTKPSVLAVPGVSVRWGQPQ